MKNIMAGVLITVAGGLLVALIMSGISAPERPNIETKLNWINFSNPIYSSDYKRDRLITEALNGQAGFNIPVELLQRFQSSQIIGLISLDIKNSSSNRSGAIDITFPNSIVFYDGQYKTGLGKNIISIGMLDPDETKNITFISREPIFSTPDIRVLDAGSKLLAVSNKIDSYNDFLNISVFVRTYPILAPNIILWLIFIILFLGYVAWTQQKMIIALQDGMQETSCTSEASLIAVKPTSDDIILKKDL